MEQLNILKYHKEVSRFPIEIRYKNGIDGLDLDKDDWSILGFQQIPTTILEETGKLWVYFKMDSIVYSPSREMFILYDTLPAHIRSEFTHSNCDMEDRNFYTAIENVSSPPARLTGLLKFIKQYINSHFDNYVGEQLSAIIKTDLEIMGIPVYTLELS